MTYLDYKRDFIKNHKNADWTTDTSTMDANGKYTKVYIFSDGAQLVEVNRPIYETVETEIIVKGIRVKVKNTVKLFETEAWNTDNPESIKFYELF